MIILAIGTVASSGTFGPLLGFAGAALTAGLALAGIYYKANRDSTDTREGRYTDNLWRTIDMLKEQADSLNEKIDALEKQRDADRTVVDNLRNEVWETRQKLFVAQGETAKLSLQIEQKEAELAYSKQVLQRTNAELEAAKHELDDLKERLAKVEQQSQHITTTETKIVAVQQPESPTTGLPSNDLLS